MYLLLKVFSNLFYPSNKKLYKSERKLYVTTFVLKCTPNFENRYKLIKGAKSFYMFNPSTYVLT